MTETHIRILQVALLAPPAAALGFARGVEVTITDGIVSGALMCAFIVSAVIIWGFLMGDLLGAIKGRLAARSPVARYHRRVTPDIL